MIIKDLNIKYKFPNGNAIALGFFDGVHLGHKKIIQKTLDSIYNSLVFTFNTKSNNKSIMNFDQKLEKIESLGVDNILAPEYEHFSNYSGEEFIRVLKNNFNVKQIICGEDFCFGRNRSCKIDDLKRISKRYGIELVVIPFLSIYGEVVSSTLIKKFLQEGQLEKANKFLGYNYYIDSVVIEGKKLGRTIGRPTINQIIDSAQIMPKYGAYQSAVLTEIGLKFSATNIGVKPTMGVNEPLVETFILDYTGNLYYKRIRVYLLKYVREEKIFNSLDELKDDILHIANSSKYSYDFFI